MRHELTVPCPFCKAAPGQRCLPNRRLLRWTHRVRVHAADLAAERVAGRILAHMRLESLREGQQ